jgi:hypothetical protein
MSKGSIIILLGLLSLIVPFTGFPMSVKTVMAVMFGAIMMGLGYLVRQERLWLLGALEGGNKDASYMGHGKTNQGIPLEKA